MPPSSPTDVGPPSSFVTKYILSCSAATVAETITYPLDLTKTRLQLAGELGKSKASTSGGRKGFIRTAASIARDNGVSGLWRGVRPAIVRHYVYTGCRMPVYEELRERVFRPMNGGRFPLWAAMCSGLTAGVVSQLLSSPMDLVKVQMQGTIAKDTSIIRCIGRLVAEGNGIRAMWRGCIPNCQRAALVNCADMATYDNVKQYLLAHTSLEDNYQTHICSSVCSGLMAAIVSTPSDVIKTRIMNQPIDPTTGRGLLYRSSLDCARQTVEREGVLALYRGFVPIWARMAPWSLTFWVSYEHIRRVTGTASF